MADQIRAEFKLDISKAQAEIRRLQREVDGLKRGMAGGVGITSSFNLSSLFQQFSRGFVGTGGGTGGGLVQSINQQISQGGAGLVAAGAGAGLLFSKGFKRSIQNPGFALKLSGDLSQQIGDISARRANFTLGHGGAFKNSPVNAALEKRQMQLESLKNNLVPKVAMIEDLVMGATGALNPLVGAITQLGKASVVAYGAMVALPLAITGASRPFIESFAQIENKRRALAGLGGNAQSTEALANLPGISRMGAYSGVIGLMSTGFNQKGAEDILKGFSTGVSAAGGSQQDLEGVIFALKQIASKGTISAEEVNQQISERLPSFRRVMGQEFGTQDLTEINSMVGANEFITRMAKAFSKLPSNIDSTSNKLEIFDDTVQKLKEGFGQGLASSVLPFMQSFGERMERLSSSGFFERLGERLGALAENSEFLDRFIENSEEAADSLVGLANSTVLLTKAMAVGGEQITSIFTGLASKFAPLGLLNGVPMPDAGTLLPPPFNTSFDKPIRAIGDMWNEFNPFYGNRSKRIEEDASRPFAGEDTNPITNLAGFYRQAAREFKKSEADAKTASEKEATIDMISIQKMQLENLRTIANNTKPDISRMVLGGGSLGAFGVTATDLSDRKGGRGKYARITKVIQEVVEDEIMNTMRELSARGVW